MKEEKEIYVSIREKPWKDLEDNNHIYKKGDIYPREGLEVTKKRIKELSSTKNKIGEILIQKVEVNTIEDDSGESEDTSEENNLEDNEIDRAEKVEDNSESYKDASKENDTQSSKNEESEINNDKNKKE